MLEVGFFIWKLSSMPSNPIELVRICKKFNIKRLAIKVLEKNFNYNTPNGDKPLMEYIDVLRNNDEYKIIVEAWGYHYPTNPGPQGDAIEERRQKLGFNTYHVNCEREWKEPYGMPAAAKLLLSKPKVNNFEMLLCSYRYPSDHKEFPFDAFMLHETINGASPQVYWALSHNPTTQMQRCLAEYKEWNKPVYPLISTFGASFKSGEKWIYWEPSVKEIQNARSSVVGNRMYCWSLDWVLNHKRYDLIEAATGVNLGDPIPEPNPESEYITIANCSWANGRSEPTSIVDNRVIIVRAGQKGTNLKMHNGQWDLLGFGPIKAWVHGDYTE